MPPINHDAPEAVKRAAPDVAEGLADARPEEDGELARAVRMNALLGVVLDAPPAPVMVGRWTLERPVGAGGMGVIYRAHGPDGHRVALKLLNQETPSSRARFEREATMLRRIDHPRVVRHIDYGVTDDGRPWLVMEWLDGEDLASRLRRGPLPLQDALLLAREVAIGLGALHRAGVVHRDVKPANLFLVGGALDNVRVVDLGVARTDSAQTRLTTTGSVLGTPHYMAPEQIQGQAGVRADVYSLGACLWECIGGAPPFRGDTPGAVLQQVLFAPSPSLADTCLDLPPAVDALVGRMLAKDPLRRPEDMHAVVLELSELLAGRGPEVALSRAERPSIPVTAVAMAPGALLGRARELGQVRGLLVHAVEAEIGVLVGITGARGMGRTALLQAAAAEWRGHHRMARCAPDEGGTPFALVRRLLGEVALWRGRRDVEPLVVADRLRLAWLDTLDAWSSEPLALFIDDVHLADLPSLRFLALAAEHLSHTPFALVFTATPEGIPPFAHSDPNLSRVPVGPLGERALRQLALRWGASREDAHLLCGGSPGELVGICNGHTGAPSWATLGTWPAEHRRVARACALAGVEPDRGCVAELLGMRPDEPALVADLAALVHGGLLVDDGGLRFQTEAAREAVLATCTDDDRRRGAAAMVRWLEGRHRPTERALHLLVLGQRAEAARAFLDAARQGVAAGDGALTERCLGAAARVAVAEQGGEVALLQAQVAFWRGGVEEAAEAAARAMAALTRGETLWFEAASVGITALGQRGANAELGRVANMVLATDSEVDARVIALCRAISQLSAVGVDVTRLTAPALGGSARSPEARAWQARARSAIALTRSFDDSIAAQIEAHQAHVLAEDPRSAAQIGLYLGSWYVWSGAWERAETAIDDALRTARRLGAPYLELWGRYVLGKLRVEIAGPRDALAWMEKVVADAASSPRIRAGAQIYASIAALRAGDWMRSMELAEAAEGHPGVFRAARAARCRAVVAGGGDAFALACELGPSEEREIEWDELVHLALVEVAPPAERASRLSDAVRRIHLRAATLADPLRRNDYLARPHLVARTLRMVEDGG